MRETRQYGSEGGEPEPNRAFLPLFILRPFGAEKATDARWKRAPRAP